MGKFFKKLLHFSCFCAFFWYGEIYALGGSFDLPCLGLRSTLIHEHSRNDVIGYSRLRMSFFERNVCNPWGGNNMGPVYSLEKPTLASCYDMRTPVSTEKRSKRILRYREENEVISYAWNTWKDLDFILMIQEESLWEEFIFGDNGTSIGYCQFSKLHGRHYYDAYMNAKNWKERLTLCHDHYVNFSKNVGAAFHGWKSRMRNLPSFTFE